MATSKKNKIYIIAGVVTLAIATYFGGKYIKKIRDEKQAKEDAEKAAELAAQQGLVNPVVPDGSKPSPKPIGILSNPFVNKAELVAFQKWVINVKKDKTILGTGGSTGFGDDGSWGSKSANAWTKYGKEYLTTLGTGDLSTKPSEKDIDFIIKYSKGTGANLQKSNLEKKPIQYIKNWVAALNVRMNTMGGGGTTFSYDGKIYNSYNGDKISDVNYYNKEVNRKATSYAFLKPDRYSGSTTLQGSLSLGKVKDMFWNDDQKLLFLYIPDFQSTYKWTTINQITIS